MSNYDQLRRTSFLLSIAKLPGEDDQAYGKAAETQGDANVENQFMT